MDIRQQLRVLGIRTGFRLQPRPAGRPSNDHEEDINREARSFAHRLVRAGYDAIRLIPEMVADIIADDIDPITAHEAAVRATRLEVEALIAEQESWPEVTDYDRLHSAFSRLEAAGIVARENFSCCGTCGVAEIDDEIRTATDAGFIVRGYTFFHVQDTEAAIEGCGLYLNFGGRSDDPEAALLIGREITDTLTASGLETCWNGGLQQRINISLRWQRRCPIPAPHD